MAIHHTGVCLVSSAHKYALPFLSVMYLTVVDYFPYHWKAIQVTHLWLTPCAQSFGHKAMKVQLHYHNPIRFSILVFE